MLISRKWLIFLRMNFVDWKWSNMLVIITGMMILSQYPRRLQVRKIMMRFLIHLTTRWYLVLKMMRKKSILEADTSRKCASAQILRPKSCSMDRPNWRYWEFLYFTKMLKLDSWTWNKCLPTPNKYLPMKISELWSFSNSIFRRINSSSNISATMTSFLLWEESLLLSKFLLGISQQL